MPDDEKPANNLINLGPGEGSKVERIKIESNYLQGEIVEELGQETTRFSDEQAQLLKFHGTYQQENRAEQYLVEDDLAGKYANGTLRITTRQGFQLHGILKGDLWPTIHTINEVLLSTLAACGDVNRNVMACPAPVASCARTQVEETTHRIAQHLAPHSHAYHEIWIDGEQVETVKLPGEEEAEPIYGPTYLPRKFKIGVAFPGDNCIDVYTQDIGLVASLEGEHLGGFTVAWA